MQRIKLSVLETHNFCRPSFNFDLFKIKIKGWQL